MVCGKCSEISSTEIRLTHFPALYSILHICHNASGYCTTTTICSRHTSHALILKRSWAMSSNGSGQKSLSRPRICTSETTRRDASGQERLRKEKLVTDDERERAEKVERRRQRKNIDERIAHLASLPIVRNVTEVASLATVNVINDQLELHRELEV